MKLLWAFLSMATAPAFSEEMSLDRINGKGYYSVHLPGASGKETHWAAEFIDAKDTAVLYKVDGQAMTAAGSYLVKIKPDVPETAQGFYYFVTSDKRPIFIMEMRDNVHDTNRKFYVFDPTKDSEGEKALLKINSDKFTMKMENDVIKIEFYNSETLKDDVMSYKAK